MDSNNVIDKIKNIPFMFIENKGSQSEGKEFFSRYRNYHMNFERQAFTVIDNKKGNCLKVTLKNSNKEHEVNGEGQLPGKINYLVGNNEDKWLKQLSVYSKVRYEEVYSNIDLVFYDKQHQLEHDFILKPGADSEMIAFSFEDAGEIKINDNGDLCICIQDEIFTFLKPKSYQMIDDKLIKIESSYYFKDLKTVGFKIEEYDKNKELIIDPILLYSSYLGGIDSNLGEGAYALEVDSLGYIYLSGYTTSMNFPLQNPLQGRLKGISDAFVTKFTPDGNSLVYSTYLGGSNLDFATGLTIDKAGNAYVVGYTNSLDFPTKNAYQATLNAVGAQNAFVTKLNSDGSSVIYSTYLGGKNTDYGNAVTLDKNECAYITGYTNSPNFPTKNPIQSQLLGINNAFITKFNEQGNGLIYSTYLGGSQIDIGNSIAVDDNECAYIAGSTNSPNFPLKNPFQSRLGNSTGLRDAFVTKINVNGGSLAYSTYLGGNGEDFGNGIAIDSIGRAYVTGSTLSSNFPVEKPIQPNLRGEANAFVTTLSVDGTMLVFSTYLGGSGFDYGNAVDVTSYGGIVVTGGTTSVNFPTKNPIQANNKGNTDAFLTEISLKDQSILFSTYLGGINLDFGSAVIATPNRLYVAGVTLSTDFPVVNPYQESLQGTADAFISIIEENANITIKKSGSPEIIYVGDTITYEISITNNGTGQANNVMVKDYLSSDVKFIEISVDRGIAINNDGNILWTIDSLGQNETLTAIIEVKALAIGDVVNRAIVTWDNMIPTPTPIEAIARTTVMTKLSTGPVLKSTKCYENISEKLVIAINNTTDNPVEIVVEYYSLEHCKKCTKVINALIEPHCTELVGFCRPSRVYKVDFDKVLKGVYMCTSIQYSSEYRECHSYENGTFIQENTMYHTQLINLLEC